MHVCINMCIDVFVDMCMDVFVDMCIDVFADACIDAQACCRHVYRCVPDLRLDIFDLAFEER